jgi:hypothetical protein
MPKPSHREKLLHEGLKVVLTQGYCGASVRFQRTYNGTQPGDPAKTAAALLHLATLPEPPLRILLGSDAYNVAEKNEVARIELDRKWKDLSYSTDFLNESQA